MKSSTRGLRRAGANTVVKFEKEKFKKAFKGNVLDLGAF